MQDLAALLLVCVALLLLAIGAATVVGLGAYVLLWLLV